MCLRLCANQGLGSGTIVVRLPPTNGTNGTNGIQNGIQNGNGINRVTSLQVMGPRGQWVVAGGRDGTLHVIEAATGRVVTQWNNHHSTTSQGTSHSNGNGNSNGHSNGHSNGQGCGVGCGVGYGGQSVTCLHCDDHMVASAGLDSKVRIWYNGS